MSFSDACVYNVFTFMGKTAINFLESADEHVQMHLNITHTQHCKCCTLLGILTLPVNCIFYIHMHH